MWPENYSANSVQKVWAAKFAARHPNVVVLDLSSFKCGHDAPTYGLIDSIISSSATPYSALHDIDANKPGGSIKIRVKTYAHTLKLHEERLEDVAKKTDELKFRIEEKRLSAAGAEAVSSWRRRKQQDADARADDQRDQAQGRRVLEAGSRPSGPGEPGGAGGRGCRAWCGSASRSSSTIDEVVARV